MKKVIILILFTFIIIGCKQQKSSIEDGVYSTSLPEDHEKIFTEMTIIVSNGKIIDIEFYIKDAARNNRIFDETYEEVMGDNQHYREQCRNDLAGLNKYIEELLEKQDIEEVDSITGATWAYDKFYYTALTLLNEIGD